MKKRTLGLVAGVASLCAIGATFLASRAPQRAVATVKREDVRLTVTATGFLEAALAFEIGPPSVRDVWNYNLKWMVPDGSVVEKGGLVALEPQKPGPRRAHKLNGEVVNFLEDTRADTPHLGIAELVVAVEEQFGLSVHPRSIERAFARRKKKRR